MGQQQTPIVIGDDHNDKPSTSTASAADPTPAPNLTKPMSQQHQAELPVQARKPGNGRALAHLPPGGGSFTAPPPTCGANTAIAREFNYRARRAWMGEDVWQPARPGTVEQLAEQDRLAVASVSSVAAALNVNPSAISAPTPTAPSFGKGSRLRITTEQAERRRREQKNRSQNKCRAQKSAAEKAKKALAYIDNPSSTGSEPESTESVVAMTKNLTYESNPRRDSVMGDQSPEAENSPRMSASELQGNQDEDDEFTAELKAEVYADSTEDNSQTTASNVVATETSDLNAQDESELGSLSEDGSVAEQASLFQDWGFGSRGRMTEAQQAEHLAGELVLVQPRSEEQDITESATHDEDEDDLFGGDLDPADSEEPISAAIPCTTLSAPTAQQQQPAPVPSSWLARVEEEIRRSQEEKRKAEEGGSEDEDEAKSDDDEEEDEDAMSDVSEEE